MHASKGVAQRLAMVCGRGQLALSAELTHHSSWLTCDRVQNFAVRVRNRRGDGQAFTREVLHQPQVVGQLFVAEPLKQGQHVGFGLPLSGDRHEEVAVLNTAADAL